MTAVLQARRAGVSEETVMAVDVLDHSIPVAEPLTVADRCDRCGAQAFVRAVLPGGSDLLFCAHHARAYDERLRAVASHVVDESDRINAKPSPSAY